MAFMRAVGDTSTQEAIIYTYWLIVLQFLKLGIAWEAIQNFTETEVNMILGVQAAIDQKQQDEEVRSMAQSSGNSMMKAMG
tara:strand:+ start:1115 stop:1357 length:243 start_codon:yes stop_codon:yes gene_type:complete